VAAAADVSVNTVFNYFSTKEELFFDQGPEFIAWPSRVVRERRRGESAVAALRRAFRKIIKSKAEGLPGARAKPFFAAIEASPALMARQRWLLEESEAGLADTLADETGAPRGDGRARTVAALVTGVEGLLSRELRRGILADSPDAALRANLSKLGEQGFDLLMAAAGDYCIKPAG
jgi:AcrR family transcriptional regulator